jgi:hypothetical protein
MLLPHPTICLHNDVFPESGNDLKPMFILDQRDTERLLTAAT